ncbi:MAG: universal stress protein [Gammaproteobacteria bacterium]|nr:universal stress protein [Gammaproteobacteria bacterium]
MIAFEHVLVLVDGAQGLGQPAIQRALRLADGGQTRLTLVQPVYVPLKPLASVLDQEQLRVLQAHASHQATERLDVLAGKLRQQGQHVDTRLAWAEHAHEAVMEVVGECRPDLVVAAVSTSTWLQRLAMTPDQRQLLRRCPCPVWLVKEPLRGGPVLAALDAGNPEPVHQELNRRVADTARSLAHKLGSPWQAVTAFTGVPLMSPADAALDIPAIDALYKDHLQAAARDYVSPLGLGEEAIHVIYGAPADALAAHAEQESAGLLVLGTLGRSGLDAFLQGNTAELVAEHAPCDVLVIKLGQTS